MKIKMTDQHAQREPSRRASSLEEHFLVPRVAGRG